VAPRQTVRIIRKLDKIILEIVLPGGEVNITFSFTMPRRRTMGVIEGGESQRVVERKEGRTSERQLPLGFLDFFRFPSLGEREDGAVDECGHWG